MRQAASRPLPRTLGLLQAATMSESSLIWGVIFGSVGLGYFVYGKKQHAVVPLVCGVVLMVLPYLVSAAWLLVVLGAAIAAVPYFVRM